MDRDDCSSELTDLDELEEQINSVAVSSLRSKLAEYAFPQSKASGFLPST
jgi:hypothetical protein